jgi:hypothetical protein
MAILSTSNVNRKSAFAGYINRKSALSLKVGANQGAFNFSSKNKKV